MKEATGELSMTAVVVVVIGVLAVALPVIIRGVVSSARHNANCSASFNCTDSEDSSGMQDCYYCSDDDCKTPTPITCDKSDS